MLTTPHSKKLALLRKRTHVPWARTDPSVRPEQWKGKMRFGTWNVRSLYREGSITAVARELARYKLDLVGVQGGRWDEVSAL
jgi:hypothetical protein